MSIHTRLVARVPKARVPVGESKESAIERRRIQRAQRLAREEEAFQRIDAYLADQAKKLAQYETGNGLHPRCSLGNPVRETTPHGTARK